MQSFETQRLKEQGEFKDGSAPGGVLLVPLGRQSVPQALRPAPGIWSVCAWDAGGGTTPDQGIGRMWSFNGESTTGVGRRGTGMSRKSVLQVG